MDRMPKIAVIMDENTSSGGGRYDTSKNYFSAIRRAGAFAFGIPYIPDLVDQVVEEFDGFLSVGGRINFPKGWYVDGDQSQYPPSDRLAVDMALMEGFLARNKTCAWHLQWHANAWVSQRLPDGLGCPFVVAGSPQS